MDVSDQELYRLIEAVWAASLGLHITPVEGYESTPDRESPLAGAIDIQGAWEGTLTLECSHHVATRAAAITFEVDPAAAGEEELLAAMCELLTTLGSNLKNLFPGSCRLSSPRVRSDSPWRPPSPSSAGCRQLGFACDGEPIHLCIEARESAHETNDRSPR